MASLHRRWPPSNATGRVNESPGVRLSLPRSLSIALATVATTTAAGAAAAAAAAAAAIVKPPSLYRVREGVSDSGGYCRGV